MLKCNEIVNNFIILPLKTDVCQKGSVTPFAKSVFQYRYKKKLRDVRKFHLLQSHKIIFRG